MTSLAAGLALALASSTLACAASPSALAHRPAAPLSCASPPLDTPTPSLAPTLDPALRPPAGLPLTSVHIEGHGAMPERWLLEVLALPADGPYSHTEVDAAAERLRALDAFVRVDIVEQRLASGVAVTFGVEPRPVISRVALAPDSDLPEPFLWHAPLPGDLHDERAIARSLRGLRLVWQAQGHLDADARAWTLPRDGVVDLCLSLHRGPSYRVGRVDLEGTSLLDRASLLATLSADSCGCNLPGKPFRADAAERSRQRMLSAYYDAGALQVEIIGPAVHRGPGAALALSFVVREGAVFRLGRLGATGALAGPAQGYTAALGLAPGEIFSRARVVEGLARVAAHHRRLSGGDGAIEPQTTLDAAAAMVDLTIVVGGR